MKLLVNLIVILSLLAVGVLGVWYLINHAREAVPLYAGQPVEPGDIVALNVEKGDPCIIEIDTQGRKPQRLPAIKEELRNLALLRDSPNVERESYLLADIPPYQGATEITLHFYGQRILEIRTRGKTDGTLTQRRYSMNSRSELIEVRDINIHPKDTGDSETSIKPIEYTYQTTQTTYALSYGCILEIRQGIRTLEKSPEQVTPLAPSKLQSISIEDSDSTTFQNEFIELLTSIKGERAKTVQDALFDSANLPDLPVPPASDESAQ